MPVCRRRAPSRETVGLMATARVAPGAPPPAPHPPGRRVAGLGARPPAGRRAGAGGPTSAASAARSCVAAIVAVLNAMLPPLVAALRLPFTVVIGFLLVLALDAAMLLLAADVAPDAAARRRLRRRARRRADRRRGERGDRRGRRRSTTTTPTRSGSPGGWRAGRAPTATDAPGHPVPRDRRARAAGPAPGDPRRQRCRTWRAGSPTARHRLLEWETDLSSQTGASQAGILLGDNDDIPAFRWVDKATGTVVTLLEPGRLRRDRAAPLDRRRAAGRRRHEPRQPALRRGRRRAPDGQPRWPTRSAPTPATARSSPTARTSRGRSCSCFWEICLELVAATRQRRRDVRPRGHRGGAYPLLRAGMCVFVRDLVVFSVLQDMFRGVPAVYATFASYDEVAHHSGPRARRHARGAAQARPALRPDRTGAPLRAAAVRDRRALRPRPDPGRDVPPAQRLRPRRAGRAVAVDGPGRGRRRRRRERDRRAARASTRRPAATDKRAADDAATTSPDRDAVVLGSGNLGLVYLMERPHRLTLEEIRERHPQLMPARCASTPTSASCSCARQPTGRSRIGARRRRTGSPTAT